MDTTIDYLRQIRGDLMDAGFQELHRRRRSFSRSGPRFSGRALIAATAAVTLAAAGTVGWFITRDDRIMSLEPSGPGSAGQATGSTGGGERFMALPNTLQYDVDVIADFAGVPAELPQAGSGALSRVIRTAEVGLVIPRDSFDDRFADAASIASDYGGYVQTSTTRERSGGITIRVPADAFDDALRDLRALGDVEVQTVRGQDVTAEFVDLQARLRIARARRVVLLRLMDGARTIDQTIRVQNALDDTQLRIEELQGQLRLLDDRTSLATIRVGLREEGVEPAAEVNTPSIPNAFERSVAGFVGVIAGVVVGLGYVIPVLALGLAAWFVVVRVRRRRATA